MSSSDSFERRLERALKFEVDDDLVDGLLPGAGDAHGRASRPARRRFAIAASVLVILAAGVTAWQVTRPPPAVPDYVRDHYRHDGADVLAKAVGENGGERLASVLARFGVQAGPALAERVRFVKFCPTPHGRGAHMIVAGADGPVTVIYMPDTAAPDEPLIRFDGVVAEVVALESGSAAIIGPEPMVDDRLAALVRDAIRTIDGGA